MLDPVAAGELDQLGYADHLLVWSFRSYARGRWRCAIIDREFRESCGPRASEALCALEVFARSLQVHGRRPVVLAPPGTCQLTTDERRLLAIYSAAQRGEAARCGLHVALLLDSPATPHFYDAARLTALALEAGGHLIGQDPRVLGPQPRRRRQPFRTSGTPANITVTRSAHSAA
jgi:hypothetical protein